MRKALKWIGIVIGGLVGLLVLALVLVYVTTGTRFNKIYDVKVRPVKLPTDKVSVRRGAHLALTVVMCRDCHGEDLGGKVMADDPMFGRLAAPNLTKGKGGIGKELDVEAIVRAVRHGVGTDGRALIVMPAAWLRNLSDEDLGDVVAYVKSVPPLNRRVPESKAGPIARILFATGQFQILNAELIDQNAMPAGSRQAAPKAGVTKAYGKYLVDVGSCRDCHKEDLAGGPNGGAPPGTPDAPDLTKVGRAMREWTFAEFAQTLRTGTRPNGTELNEFMPWKYIGRDTATELKAIWLYLRTVPPKKTAG